jgi:GNAT superfamily N-acetyltransferase
MEQRLGKGITMQPGGTPESLQPSKYEARPYKPEDASLIYRELEEPNWAPWLAASAETLAKRAEVFPEGQIALWGADGKPVASLSLNRFSWDGDVENLPTWDDLAGDPPTYESTYNPNGNSVGMMSINVRKDIQGAGLTQELIEAAREACSRLGIQNVMGSFRPSQFGQFSKDNPELEFDKYVHMTDERGLPVDKWIRALHRNGMRMLKIDDGAMIVDDVPREQVEEWRRTYKPEEWTVKGHIWRCGETGFWYVGPKKAMYAESNVWGILDKNGNGNAPSEKPHSSAI